MVERLTQPCRVQDEGPMGCKLLLAGNNYPFSNGLEGTG